ncbi:MAG: two pore domain potassium channel family protein [Gammaproteobacteria bacterium]|nr:MAG: two pore domain potassium channel family protein [Gammaproteobacteria bacterium]
MTTNLLIGLPTMFVCLVLQSVLFVYANNYYHRHDDLVNSPSFWSSVLVVMGVMLILVIGNIAQVAVWAYIFVLLEEFQVFNEAFYHSAVNFATLGYGDIVMSDRYKLLGPLEAMNGVLMIGITTAALMSAFQDAMRRRQIAKRG